MKRKIQSKALEQIESNIDLVEKIDETKEVGDRILEIEELSTNELSKIMNALFSGIESIESELTDQKEVEDDNTLELTEEIQDEIQKNSDTATAMKKMESNIFNINVSETIELAENENAEYKDIQEKLEESMNGSVDEAIKSVINTSVLEDVLPSEKRGRWSEGVEGNGKFTLNDDAVITCGSIKMTGAEIKKKYGTGTVEYKNNDPNFYPFAQNDNYVRCVTIDNMPTTREGKNGTYALAEKICALYSGKTVSEIREYMKQNHLTWHETPDRKHIIPIPTIINAAFGHTGGISKEQSFQAITKTIGERFNLEDSRTLSLVKDEGALDNACVNADEVKNAINSTKSAYLSQKRNMFKKH